MLDMIASRFGEGRGMLDLSEEHVFAGFYWVALPVESYLFDEASFVVCFLFRQGAP